MPVGSPSASRTFYAGRTVQVLKVAGAGPDHPFLAQVPESRYLKAAFCRVLD